MKTQIMLDLETLGNLPGSVIVAIGAVKFDDCHILDRFYTRIDPQSCVKAGLKMQVSTVLWWLRQDEAPRLEIAGPGEDIGAALFTFRRWVDVGQEVEIWGNGAAFDNVLLRDAYEALGIEEPWKFWNDRCYRTMKAMFPEITLERSGQHHHALDDAESQARHLMAILQKMRGAS